MKKRLSIFIAIMALLGATAPSGVAFAKNGASNTVNHATTAQAAASTEGEEGNEEEAAAEAEEGEEGNE